MHAHDTSVSLHMQAPLVLRHTRQTCKLASMEKETKARPFRAQGDKLREARGNRPMRAIKEAVQLSSVQTYQNWEMGYNRPKPNYWAALSRALHLNVANLYAGADQSGSRGFLDANEILPFLANIRKNLEALEDLVRSPSDNQPTDEEASVMSTVRLRRGGRQKSAKKKA